MFIHPLIGKWVYTDFIYQGRLHPLPNPKLYQYFDFSETEVTLYYSSSDEGYFCERKALYQYSEAEQELMQKVTWTNPLNGSLCSKDPDMTLGSASYNKVYIKDNKLYLHTTLSDEEIILIWTREKI